MVKVIYSELVILLAINTIVIYGSQLEEQSLVTYHRCLLDIHCQSINENSFCFGNDETRPGLCKCKDGYELLSRNRTFFACLKHAGWDEPCEKNVQCYYLLSTHAICDTTCKCAESSHQYVDGRCYPSIRLGDFCQANANCLLNDGSFANCVDGKCECRSYRELPTDDGMSCIETRNLGDLCDNDQQCSFIGDAVCRVNCRCAAGFVLSLNETRCLRAATGFFQPCEENAQCSEFLQRSICNNGTCACPENFHGTGRNCVRSIGIGEACIGPEQCIRNNNFMQVANCTSGVCQCLPDLVDESVDCGSNRTFYNFITLTICSLCIYFSNLLVNYK